MWVHFLRKKVDIVYHNSVMPISDKDHWLTKKCGFILSKFIVYNLLGLNREIV
jgi:hypothetical protein